MQNTILDFKKGDKVFDEGDVSDDLYIIQSGVVLLYKTTETGIIPLAVLSDGSFLGEQSFVDKRPRGATAEAGTDLKLIKLESEKLHKEIEKFPSWLISIIKGISERVRNTNEVLAKNDVKDEYLQAEFDKYK